MVKDHSDSERGNPLPPHGLLFCSKIYTEHYFDGCLRALVNTDIKEV